LGAFASPTALLVGVALLGLLGLHLQSHAVNLLCLNPKPLQELFTGLLVATESAETGSVGVLLAAVDAKSHASPSVLSVR